MEEILKILIVDDDEIDRMAIRRALKSTRIPIELSEASNCNMALMLLRNLVFDCIFLDYQMPDRDGLATLQDLREAKISVPVVMLTGRGDEQIAVELMKAGAADYLTKSKFSPQILAQTLRRTIRVHRAEKEAEIANQQRLELARQQEDFVSRMTHDLRTPLVAADRMLTLLKNGSFGSVSPEMNEAFASMIRSNQNLLQMVNTLLEVYRHDAGQKVLHLIPVNLKQLISEIIQELHPLAQEKGLLLTTDWGTSQGIVNGDRSELRRALVNLVGNAIKFTDIGSVQIRLIDAPPWRICEITDTGTGIPPAEQPTLFERFRQGNHRRSGSGLGLYLTRRIVEAHGGTIVLRSELGKGSTFIVQLPS